MLSTNPSNVVGEKKMPNEDERRSDSIQAASFDDQLAPNKEDGEIFKDTEGGVKFRTVGWIRASIIFLKVQFALGVLGIPVAFDSLGAVGGALSVIGWGALNHWAGIIQGDFRNRHPGCHSVADMAGVVGGTVVKELVGGLFVIAYVLCTGSGIIGLSTGLNALSHHAACTVWWSLIAAVVIASFSSFRRFHAIGWVTWAGFISIFTAVLIVVIAVTQQSRPAAAPAAPAPYDLGYQVIAHPTFIAGITATATIFISSAGSSAFIPVIAEMKNPKDYRKSIVVCNTIVNSAYLSFSLVVYKYCGQWVASPSLGSAGQTIKMVSYGIALIGLMASGVIYCHTAAKYVFVRILRNSPHLQNGSIIHWTVWLSCTFGLAALSFILAEAIPIFNYILALTGSICFAPLGLILPGFLWLYDFRGVRKEGVKGKLMWGFHWWMVLLGCFLCVAGTYATVVSIIDAYKSGEISSSFSCADNSGSS